MKNSFIVIGFLNWYMHGKFFDSHRILNWYMHGKLFYQRIDDNMVFLCSTAKRELGSFYCIILKQWQTNSCFFIDFVIFNVFDLHTIVGFVDFFYKG